MPKWIWFTIIVMIVWLVGRTLWYKVIRPYFRQEVITVRTSVFPEQQENANEIDDKICCFCLAQPKVFRLVVTCSHSFCADCILGYYRKKNNERIDCPLCRKDIIALFKAFEEKQPVEKIQQIRQQLAEYNRKFGDDRSMQRKIKQLPAVLIQTMNFIFSQNFLVFFLSSAVFLKTLGAIILYQILPYDIMPASLLGSVGYVDNTLVIVIFSAFAVGQAALQYYTHNQ